MSHGTIDESDFDRLTVTDDPVHAATCIRDAAIRHFGLSYRRPRRRYWFFGER